MGSLAGCLKTLGITGPRAQFIRETADTYRKEGFAAQDANERALKDLIKETRREQRRVYDQIYNALPEDQRAAVFPESAKIPEQENTPEPETPLLASEQFAEQLRAAATSPEEADVLLALAQANADYKGQSLDDWVGENIAGVELVSREESEYLGEVTAQKTGKTVRGIVKFLDDNRAIIQSFTEARNASTLAHELGHVFRRTLKPEELSKVESALGVKRGKWNRKNEERFARMWERYLRDGKAPNRTLKEVFRQFKEWLTAIYRNLRNSPLAEQIPAEVHEVFDTMLGGRQWHPDPAVQREIDGMYRRGNVHEETLEQLESLPPEAITQIIQEAQGRAGVENEVLSAIRTEYNTLFGTTGDDVITWIDKQGKKRQRRVSEAGESSARARMVERSGGDPTKIPGFDEKVQDLRDGEFPYLAAEASSRGRGDMEAGLFDIVQGGRSQFDDRTIDEYIDDILGEYHESQIAGQPDRGEGAGLDDEGTVSQGSGDASGEGIAEGEVSDSINFGANVEDSFSLSREGSPDKSPVVEQYTVPESERVAPQKKAERQPTLTGIPEDFDENVLPGQQGLFAQEDSSRPTSTKNAVTDKERSLYGLPPAKNLIPESVQQWDAEAKQVLQRNPSAGKELVDAVLEQPRTLSDRENAIVLNYKVRLQNEFSDVSEKLIEAHDSGDDVAARDFQARSDQLSDKLFNLFEAARQAGTEWGRAGIARQMMMNDDFSLAAMVGRKRQAVGGRQLTAQENAAIIELQTKVAELEQLLKKAEAHRAAKEEAEAKAVFDKEYDSLKKKARGERRKKQPTIGELKEKLGKQPRKPKPRQPATLESIRAKLLKTASGRAKKFAALFNRKRSDSVDTLAQEDFDGADPELMAAAVEMATTYREAGIKNWQDFSKAVSDTIGSDTAKAAEDYLRAAWERSTKPAAKPSKPASKPAEPEASGTLDVDALSDARLSNVARELAKYFIQQGVKGRDNVTDAVWAELQKVLPDITRRETMDAISLYGQYKLLNKDPLAQELRKYAGELQQVAKLYDIISGKPPKKTGQERRTPSDEERHLIALVNEYKKKYNIQTTDPARQLQSALGAIKTRLRNQIKDLDQQIKTRQRLVKNQSSVKYDAEAEALAKERDALKEQFDAIFGKRARTDMERLKAAEKAMEKQWKDYDKKIQNRDFGDPTRPLPPDSPTLFALKILRDAAREQYKALKALDPANKAKADAVANQRLRAAIVDQMAELARKLQDRDFSTKKRATKKLTLEAETERLQSELDALKTQFHEELLTDRQKRRLEEELNRRTEAWKAGKITQPQTRPRRATPASLRNLEARVKSARRRDRVAAQQLTSRSILSWAAEPLRVGRALILGVDFGQVLNQGKLAMGHPLLNMRALPRMFKAWASEGVEQQLTDEIENHPDFGLAYNAGLDLTTEEGGLTTQEEIFQGHLANKIPLLNNFGRAYRVFLNKLRFDLFTQMLKAHGGEVTDEQAKVLANYINVSTGRGAFTGTWATAAVPFNDVFLAPRFQVSRIQWLIGQPLWGAGKWENTGRARAVVAQEYARSLASLAVYYGLVSLAAGFLADDDDKPTIETDPRSSDFGKVVIGKTRIDPWAGAQQWFVFASRMWSGETKPVGDDTEAIALRGDEREYGARSGKEVFADFARGRLAPVPGAIYDKFIAGETFDKKEPTVLELSKNLYTPITPREIYNTTKEEGIPKGMALGLLMMFGERVNTYTDQLNTEKYRDDPAGRRKRINSLRKTIRSGTRRSKDETLEEYLNRKKDHAERKERAKRELAALRELSPT